MNRTYISLFSCAGVGCFGFKEEGFACVASVELNQRRLNVQKYNHKCKYDSGYICGDMTSASTKDLIFAEIKKWQELERMKQVDVLIATPPCQGISVQNHKKKDEINRNSLVIESIEMVSKVLPKIFIFENVMAFEKTLCCTKENQIVPIGDYIRETLGGNYIISSRILNFMNYGSNSSRTRTLVIGVEKSYRETIAPFDLYPSFQKEKTLWQVIGDFKTLKWGEISKNDFYHAFRTYEPRMRDWIHDLKEGESAFDNSDPEKRPHKIVNGKIVENIKKNRDKYTRQRWDRFVQCIHTRNDQLAAQNTIHPNQDRVFSIRELMVMMTIPNDFRWLDYSLEELNSFSEIEKKKLYKENETNIRQCIGEAVPTVIMRQIAHNISVLLDKKNVGAGEINRIIEKNQLTEKKKLLGFLDENPCDLDLPTLMRITELCNAEREKNAAFYTNKFLVNETIDKLPDFSIPEIRILEPSVGAGSFLPILIKKYAYVSHVIIDVIDIDAKSIENLKVLLKHLDIPDNFEINFICCDFLSFNANVRYNLAVGNPPFTKINCKAKNVEIWLQQNVNKETRDVSEMFLEKCMRLSDCVALILNKNILCAEEFFPTHEMLRHVKIDSIIDFGRFGFTGVSIETICLIIYPKSKPSKTTVYNMKYNKIYHQNQSYITDKKYPYFIIYRDANFDSVAQKLEFNVFSVFRDRQITKKNSTKEKKPNHLWVLKARNINSDTDGISHIPNYDTYIDNQLAQSLSTYQFFNNESVYLTPNMTYKTRLIKNIPNTVVDGSVAVLIPKKDGMKLSSKQLAYFSSEEYRNFYITARNFSTQSINVDNNSVYFYGVLNNDQ